MMRSMIPSSTACTLTSTCFSTGASALLGGASRRFRSASSSSSTVASSKITNVAASLARYNRNSASGAAGLSTSFLNLATAGAPRLSSARRFCSSSALLHQNEIASLRSELQEAKTKLSEVDQKLSDAWLPKEATSSSRSSSKRNNKFMSKKEVAAVEKTQQMSAGKFVAMSVLLELGVYLAAFLGFAAWACYDNLSSSSTKEKKTQAQQAAEFEDFALAIVDVISKKRVEAEKGQENNQCAPSSVEFDKILAKHRRQRQWREFRTRVQDKFFAFAARLPRLLLLTFVACCVVLQVATHAPAAFATAGVFAGRYLQHRNVRFE